MEGYAPSARSPCGIVGLGMSGVVLALMSFGVSGVLITGRTDLMYVVWPSSCDARWRLAHHDSGHHDHSIVSCDQLLAAHGTCICAKRQPTESPLIGLNSELVLTSVPVLNFCPGLVISVVLVVLLALRLFFFSLQPPLPAHEGSRVLFQFLADLWVILKVILQSRVL